WPQGLGFPHYNSLLRRLSHGCVIALPTSWSTMTDIIYGNINIETKERMRKLLRPQVLTAIATVASAVAAFISLYVALRLEDATYHSQYPSNRLTLCPFSLGKLLLSCKNS